MKARNPISRLTIGCAAVTVLAIACYPERTAETDGAGAPSLVQAVDTVRIDVTTGSVRTLVNDDAVRANIRTLEERLGAEKAEQAEMSRWPDPPDPRMAAERIEGLEADIADMRALLELPILDAPEAERRLVELGEYRDALRDSVEQGLRDPQTDVERAELDNWQEILAVAAAAETCRDWIGGVQGLAPNATTEVNFHADGEIEITSFAVNGRWPRPPLGTGAISTAIISNDVAAQLRLTSAFFNPDIFPLPDQSETSAGCVMAQRSEFLLEMTSPEVLRSSVPWGRSFTVRVTAQSTHRNYPVGTGPQSELPSGNIGTVTLTGMKPDDGCGGGGDPGEPPGTESCGGMGPPPNECETVIFELYQDGIFIWSETVEVCG